MKICDLIPYKLPVVERAVNLRFGIWLILSATADFVLRESMANDTSHLSAKVYPGCRICIYTLPCGHQLRGPNIFIRSDLQSCSKVPSIKIHVDLPVPLLDVLSVLPSINELPSYNTKSLANLDLLRSLKHEMKYISPTALQTPDALRTLAQPIALKMTDLKNPLKREFSHIPTFKTALIMGLTSFLISMLLHLLFMYLFHRYNNLHKFMPFKHTLKTDDKKIKVPLHPVLWVHSDHLNAITADPKFRWRNKCRIATHNPSTEPQHYTEILPV